MNKRAIVRLSGIRLMVQAAFSFSLMLICVRYATNTLPSFEVVFFRSLIGVILISIVMFTKKIPFIGTENRIMWVRGISGFIALALHFYTIARLPLGTAVLLNYTGPVFSAILAILFLGERMRWLLVAMFFVSFSGVYLLVGAQPPDLSWNIFLGILSAIFSAIATVSIRMIRQKESPYTIVFYFTAISTAGSLFLLPFDEPFRWPNLREWLFLGGVGFFSFFAQLWLTQALRRAPASLVSPFLYLTPALSFFYGLFLFGEKLSPHAALGFFMVIIGGSLISYFEYKPRRKKS